MLPTKSFLHDLYLRTEGRRDGATATLRFVPELTGRTGAVRLGVLATLTDAVAGRLAVRASLPNLVATSHIELQTARPIFGGPVLAHGKLIRKGRSSLAIGVAIHEAEAPDPNLHASAIFSVIPGPGDADLLRSFGESDAEVVLGGPDSVLSAPFVDRVGVRVRDADAGVVELELTEDVHNHLGALQGGIVATLAEFAGELAAGARRARPLAALDLSVNYLALGKVGPFRTRSSVLREGEGWAVVRVQVLDTGLEDRLIASANVVAGEVAAS